MQAKRFLSLFLVSFISAVLAVGIFSFFKTNKIVYVTQESPISRFTNFSGAENIDFTKIAEKAVHAVVHVKTQYERRLSNWDFFFGGDYNTQLPPAVSYGSGVIISPDGYIVTNNHVIENSNNIEVVLNDKRTFVAKLVGTDPTTDIALLKIEGENFSFLEYGNSDTLKVGEWVLAVGNPFNLTSTVTAGIVSAKGRSIDVLERNNAIESFIQTDAAVNPGNSGGALVNTRGELIGINTAIASRTGSYAGYSFAVPVNLVGKVVKDLKEFGTVQRAYLGINIQDVDATLARELNLEKPEGVYVANVQQGASAAEAGIAKGDVILKVGKIVVNKVSELQEQVGKYRPGDKISVTILRNGSQKEVNILLKNRLGNTDAVKVEKNTVLGATLQEVSDAEKSRLRIRYGVQVTDIAGGKFFAAGIRKGFIIVAINQKPIQNVADVQKALDEAEDGVFLEGIYPNGISAYYAFGIK